MSDERRPPSPSDIWPTRLREGTGTAADLLRRYDKQSLATPPAGAAWERTVVGLGRAARAVPWKFGAAILAGACATALVVALGPWPAGHQVKVAARLERVPAPTHQSGPSAGAADVATTRPPTLPPSPQASTLADRGASLLEVLHDGSTILRPGTRVRLQRGARAVVRSERFEAPRAPRPVEIVLDHGSLTLENERRGSGSGSKLTPDRDGQPLVVIAAPYRLVVLGAAFRVSRSGGRVGIVVDEGHVRVSRDDDAVADLGRGARWSGPTLLAKRESQKRRGIIKTGERRSVVAGLFATGASAGAATGGPGIGEAGWAPEQDLGPDTASSRERATTPAIATSAPARASVAPSTPALARAAEASAAPAAVPGAPAASTSAALTAPAAPTAVLAAPPTSAPTALAALARSPAPAIAPASAVAPALAPAPSPAVTASSATTTAPGVACPPDAPGETRFRCWWSRGQGSGLSAEAALFEAAVTASRGLHDPARAVKTLRALLARFPHGALRAEAHAALAEALPELGRYEEARAEASEALEAGIAPGTSQAAGLHLLRARAAAHEGDCTAAAADFRQAAVDPHLARVARAEAARCAAKPERGVAPQVPAAENRP